MLTHRLHFAKFVKSHPLSLPIIVITIQLTRFFTDKNCEFFNENVRANDCVRKIILERYGYL